MRIRFTDAVPPVGHEGVEPGQPFLLETTLGRALFNEALPEDYAYENGVVDKKVLGRIVNDLAERYAKIDVAATLDALKAAGFHWATRSGVTIAADDVIGPPAKAGILEHFEKKTAETEKKYERGQITDGERREELIRFWDEATRQVADEMQKNFDEDNSVFLMVNSGARGNWLQIRQLAGMRGLVANPKGETIPRPIKSSFREGLSVLEFFISTHGARKGLADTALRTADSGYLTRRLVDVAQDVIIREEDCGTERGLAADRASEDVETSVYARTLATDVTVDGAVLVPAGVDLGDPVIRRLVEAGVQEVRVRSVLTCDSAAGVCAACYGRSLASGKRVEEMVYHLSFAMVEIGVAGRLGNALLARH